MTENMKEACRIIIEAADQLQLHDEEYTHVTSPALKLKIQEFLRKHSLDTPDKIVEKLQTKRRD